MDNIFRIFFFFVFWTKGLCENHAIINEQDGNIIQFVSDSPFLLRQPHSLIDLLNQVRWFDEKVKLKSSVKFQQQNIEKRYNDDDPNLELKIRENDKNCIKSRPLDLQTENFVSTYTIDLLPNYLHSLQFKNELNVFFMIHETLKLSSFEKLFMTKQTSVKTQEPLCQKFVELQSDVYSDEEIDAFKNIVSLDLPNMSEAELQQLGSFLTDQFNEKTEQLALYYSSFYWQLRGNTKNAIKCLIRYLSNDDMSGPACLQLGMLYIKYGMYREAIELIKVATNQYPLCIQCFMALGDAYVLSVNFVEAINAYEKAKRINSTFDAALKKISLLKCVSKVFEVMERQHSDLLNTIDDVYNLKDRINLLKLLDNLLEGNLASLETRIQSKFAYEYYIAGPAANLNCDTTNKRYRVLGKLKIIKRLHCEIKDLVGINTSLTEQYEYLTNVTKKKSKLKFFFNNNDNLTEADKFSYETHKLYNESVNKNLFYLKKLTPYIGLEINQPQVAPKYPLQNIKEEDSIDSKKLFLLKKSNCEQKKDIFLTPEYQIDSLNLFMSPENKGFLVFELLTKYLALKENELSPMPWRLPFCGFLLLSDESKTDSVFKLESISELIKKSNKIFPTGDYRLKSILLNLLNNKNSNNNANFQFPFILLSELGQRIATLLKYKIGPEWISTNLAALFFRYFGWYSESLTCLKVALQKDNLNKDNSYVQMAQILLHLVIENKKLLMSLNSSSTEFQAIVQKNKLYLNDTKIIINKSLTENNKEPLIYYLFGVMYELNEEMDKAEEFYKFSLTLDPNYKISFNALLRVYCQNKSKRNDMLTFKKFQLTIFDKYAPLCCWPSEQNVYCFKNENIKKYDKKINKIYGSNFEGLNSLDILCFKINTTLEPPYKSTFVYFRCANTYTGHSYQAPAFARLIVSYLKITDELRQLKYFNQLKEINNLFLKDDNNLNLKKNIPVLPLDYGGYSEKLIQEHQMHIPEFNVDDLGTFSIEFDNSINQTNKEKKVEKFDKIKNELSSNFLSISLVTKRIDILKYDIPLLKSLPQPFENLVIIGMKHFPNLSRADIQKYCSVYKEDGKLLDQPASTYVSVTAKGIQIVDFLDFSTPIETIQSVLTTENQEPVCPNPATSKILDEFDQLPAYLYRNQLKFYWPEKALRDALQTLGYANQKMNIKEVATRLAFAMQSSDRKDQDGGVDWTLSTASTLYWRVKGDAINAIKCLRHSLNNSPHNMKDVALISMANIYHQAGFLHSALLVGGHALKISPDSVVAIHFTLASIYVSMGDFSNALKFYYSTLALQSKFESVKDRIRAIHCETNGKFL